MSITIKGSPNGATFTVTQDGITVPYSTNTAYLKYEQYGGTNTMVCVLRKAGSDKIIFSQEPTNIINGDTGLAFADYASVETYVVANFFAPINGNSIINTKCIQKTFIDASITNGTGISVQISPANINGYGIQIFNSSINSTVWINNTGGTANTNGIGSFAISPGGYYEDRLTNSITAMIVNGQPLTVKLY